MCISIYTKNFNIIVDLGDIAISIPTRYACELTNIRFKNNDIVYFIADGVEDFLSVKATIFGEAPYYTSFKYSLIKDSNNVGVEGLKCIVSNLSKVKGGVKLTKTKLINKDSYKEVCMVVGDVFCAKKDENGEVYIKVYNENGKPYVAYFRLDLRGVMHIISSTYPQEFMKHLVELLGVQLEFILDYVGNK